METLVLPIDWSVYLGEFNKTRRFYQKLVRKTRPQVDLGHSLSKESGKARPALLSHLEQTPPGQRRSSLIIFIQQEMIRLVGLASDVDLDPDRPLNSYGLDSLMAVEMRNSLSTSLGKSLPASLLFDYPTGLALADYLMQNIPGLLPETETSVQIEKAQQLVSDSTTSSIPPPPRRLNNLVMMKQRRSYWPSSLKLKKEKPVSEKSATIPELSPVKQALLEIRELNGRLEEIERRRSEPIAIIGIGLRFPGADNLEAFWDLLENGVDAIREIPSDRWDLNAFFELSAANTRQNEHAHGWIRRRD